MGNELGRLIVELPDWARRHVDLSAVHATDEDRMRLAIELARQNVAHGGGPFGAAVFDMTTGLVVAPGVNLVLESNCSVLHAEIVAIMLAQARLGTWTMGGGSFELVASSEPCAQCLGAIFWSGVRRLVSGASRGEAEAIGFDEGPRRDDWRDDLTRRHIELRCGVLAAEAREVLQDYARRGKIIYNALPAR